MNWTATNIVIQTITGILGAHGAAVAAHEHRFDFLGHTMTGALAGATPGPDAITSLTNALAAKQADAAGAASATTDGATPPASTRHKD